MITHEGQTTSVQFGKEGIGSVGLTGKNGGVLTIQQLTKTDLLIGGIPEDGDIAELPKVVLNFTDTKSIDALIEVLTRTKYKMIYPYPSYCYAC